MVFVASAEGKITVLKASGQWEVLGVNGLGEEIHPHRNTAPEDLRA